MKTSRSNARGIATIAACALLFLGGGLWVYAILMNSLPVLDGVQTLPGLQSDVSVTRDQLGVVTVEGQERGDVARGLGYVHAQERFFQMDLLRRAAAGELAELFGSVALELDKRARFHQLRDVAQNAWRSLNTEHRQILQAYADGVNAGLEQLAGEPFEYVVLRQNPRLWQPADSFLVALAMFLDLQDELAERHGLLAVLSKIYPPEVIAFLVPKATEWDAPLYAEKPISIALPTIEQFNPRAKYSPLPRPQQRADWRSEDVLMHAAASNSWAVDGPHSSHGGSLLAGDMHLNLRVPNVWFRVQLKWVDAATQRPRTVTGVTLPGGPVIIAGSNTNVAWAFTNSYVDTAQLVTLDVRSLSNPTYQTAKGWVPLEDREEHILVKGANPVTLKVPVSRWGPVRVLANGTYVAVRWVGQHADAVNFVQMIDLESASTVDQALAAAQHAEIPAQNIVSVDDQGKIGWTIAGRIPRRGAITQSWVDWRHADESWTGWLDPRDVPQLISPNSGRVWTANNRLISESDLLGDGGYVLGARALQISTRLKEQNVFSEHDMLRIQLDDQALFLERWRAFLLKVLDEEAVQAHPQRAQLRDLVLHWSGHAAVNDPGYRMVRAFRLFLATDVFDVVLNQAQRIDPLLPYQRFAQWEAPLWQIVNVQPSHFLHPELSTWREQFLQSVDRVISLFEKSGQQLADRTWGERNRLEMTHPFAKAVPWLAKWLSMPSMPLPGDEHMPRVQSPGVGSSQRMVVSPGREELGIFHMPGGQSGHALSPFFSAGHREWAEGKALPFLPGPVLHRLRLTNQASTGLSPWWKDVESN